MIEGIRRRLDQQRAQLALARRAAEGLRQPLGARTAVVFGSIARGDFHDGSDVDLLVIADKLPAHPADRIRAMIEHGTLGVDIFAYTPDEAREMLRHNHPTVYWARREGLVLFDDGLWTALAAASAADPGRA